MAKSTKHQDALGAYDNFMAPWESEAGTDTEIDKGRLKRLIFNLKLDHAKARDTAEDAKADLATAETERDEAKSQAADGSGAEAQKKIDKLTADLEKVTGERDKLQEEKATSELRAEVLGDFATTHPKAAKYVVGTTKEELEESLEAVKEDFGISDDDEGDENEEAEEDDDTPQVRTRPRPLTNPADKKNGKGGEQEYDFDKVAGEISVGGSLFG